MASLKILLFSHVLYVSAARDKKVCRWNWLQEESKFSPSLKILRLPEKFPHKAPLSKEKICQYLLSCLGDCEIFTDLTNLECFCLARSSTNVEQAFLKNFWLLFSRSSTQTQNKVANKGDVIFPAHWPEVLRTLLLRILKILLIKSWNVFESFTCKKAKEHELL